MSSYKYNPPHNNILYKTTALDPGLPIHPLDDDTHNASDTKVHYVKIISKEFRNLQLDENLKSKSVFDLIDYCELLYEELSELINTEQGLTTYIKGYLIFNYFINSFIMMHFEGFDKFIETNEPDFIIYLNIFAFYNTDDIIRNDSYIVPLRSLRKWVLEYLSLKSLLKFDVNELYQWLFQYIEYLKNKDSMDQDRNQAPTMSNSNPDLHDPNGTMLNLDPMEEDDDASIFEFKSKYPMLNNYESTDSFSNPYSLTPPVQKNKYNKPPPPPIPTSALPPIPSVAPPPVPKHTSTSPSLGSTPYPLAKGEATPYPTTNSSADELYFGDHPSSNGSHALSTKNRYDHANEIPSYKFESSGYSRPPTSVVPVPTRTRPPVPVPTPVHANGSIQSKHNGSYSSPNGNGSPAPSYGNNPIHPHQLVSHHHHNNGHSHYQQQQEPHYNGYNGHAPPMVAHQTMLAHQYQHHTYQHNQVSHHNNAKSQKLYYMKEYSICGLKNFGSSCYINLTIQLLFGLSQLKSIFSNLEYHKYIKDPKYVRLMKMLQASKDTLLLSEAISGLLRTFMMHGSSSIAPTKFLRVASSLKPDFNIPHEQQDAQEFLLFVLERLHEELSYKHLTENIDLASLEKYISKWNININAKDRDEYLKWYQSLIKSEGKSPVNDLFQGHLQNKLICNKCGFESINYSPFTILSLPIPNNTINGVVDLADCLRYYTQDEVLTGENAWNCPKCHKPENNDASGHALDNHPVFTPKRSGIFKLAKRSKSPSKKPLAPPTNTAKNTSISIKTLMFIKLPQILFIHLSRFSMFNLTDKLNTVIKYPLQLKFNNNSNNINHEITYKLTGLINHYGNLKSGHYTSIINKSTVNQSAAHKNNDNIKHPYWCLFDDESVKLNIGLGYINEQGMDCSDLHSRDVYVLCYERI